MHKEGNVIFGISSFPYTVRQLTLNIKFYMIDVYYIFTVGQKSFNVMCNKNKLCQLIFGLVLNLIFS